MIRLAIVDDEESSRKQLRQYIDLYSKQHDTDFSVTEYADGDEVVEHYDASFDLILMDIQMPFMDGMTAAEKIREKDADVILLFITNRADYAIRGYRVDALDYILKPVTYFAFSEGMERALVRLRKHESGNTVTVTLRTGGIQKIGLDELYYVESRAHLLIFHAKSGDFETYGTMKDCEEKLSSHGFFRSNKGYLVNLAHVDGVRDGCCIVNGQNLIISRARKKEFLTTLAAYMQDL